MSTISSPLVYTFPADATLEQALERLPTRGPPPSEVMVHTGSVESVDACTGVAVAAIAEYHGRYHQRRVTVSRPQVDAAWTLLRTMVAPDHPSHLVLSDDCSPPARGSRAVFLPAVRLMSIDEARAAAEAILENAGGQLKEPVRYAAKTLPELVANSLSHGSDSPIPPLACVIHDRPQDEIQVAVCDLGERVARDHEAVHALEEATESPDSGLGTLVAAAERRGLDVSLSLISGYARRSWRSGAWSSATGTYCAGFTAIFTIPV